MSAFIVDVIVVAMSFITSRISLFFFCCENLLNFEGIFRSHRLPFYVIDIFAGLSLFFLIL